MSPKTTTPRLERFVAFSDSPDGGNPAGVWVGDALPSPHDMQRIAAEVGYSETAFVAPSAGTERTVRYFSPKTEVPFCGHATIALGAALGASDGEGTYRLATPVGAVPLSSADRDAQGGDPALDAALEALLLSADP